jgi:secretion/DNA translocation related TadE-like protein
MRADDSGIATVWAAGAIVALVAVAGLMFSLGSVMVTRHRVDDAADLAALAAAGRADQGSEAACEGARRVTERMAVRLVNCRLRQWDAFVEVEAAIPGAPGAASAHARAGPVTVGERDIVPDDGRSADQ